MENRELEHRLFIDESMILDNHKKLEDLKVNVNVNTGIFDPTSDNPAGQKSIAGAMEKKQDKLTAGNGIKIEDNKLSSYNDDWSFKYSGVTFTHENNQKLSFPDSDINAEQMLSNTSIQSPYGTEYPGTFYIDNLHAKNAYALMSHSKIQKVVFRGTGYIHTFQAFCFTNMPNVTSIEVDGDYKLTGNLYWLFALCPKLKTIGAFDVSAYTNDVCTQTFAECTSLKELKCVGWSSSFDLHSSTAFERSDLLLILNNLHDQNGQLTRTLTLGATNLAKLTDEDKAIATNKNWILA